MIFSSFLLLISCSPPAPKDTVVVVIESSPTNLDPRIGTDAQSARIQKLIFDSLLRRDESFNLQPWVAERWEIPDPLTYVFHLRSGIRFHDGQPLSARDVKWTIDTLLTGKVTSIKAGAYRLIDHIEAPDDATVIFHLKEPYSELLWNLSDGAIGIVPYGSAAGFNLHPVGSGPFRFVSMEHDKDVVLERSDQYWGAQPLIRRARFVVVPDPTTRALEMRKGSADVAVNSLSPDVVLALRHDPALVIETSEGTIYQYLALNLRDPILQDVRVRQALAYALDRQTIIRYLWRDLARPAEGILPPQHWAYEPNVRTYDYDPPKARALLEDAGYPEKNGVRFHLTMKTSTAEESSRLLAAVLQQQLRAVGIALDIRTYEFATFYADVTKGAFQLFSLRWIGGNESPDIFESVFHSASFPPKRANRGYYSNSRVDGLIDAARRTLDPAKRRELYTEIQRILAEDLPYINLWYIDNVLVHSRRVSGLHLGSSANYDFLTSMELRPR